MCHVTFISDPDTVNSDLRIIPSLVMTQNRPSLVMTHSVISDDSEPAALVKYLPSCHSFVSVLFALCSHTGMPIVIQHDGLHSNHPTSDSNAVKHPCDGSTHGDDAPFEILLNSQS